MLSPTLLPKQATHAVAPPPTQQLSSVSHPSLKPLPEACQCSRSSLAQADPFASRRWRSHPRRANKVCPTKCRGPAAPALRTSTHTHIHTRVCVTHTHTHTHTRVSVRVCVCVCVSFFSANHLLAQRAAASLSSGMTISREMERHARTLASRFPSLRDWNARRARTSLLYTLGRVCLKAGWAAVFVSDRRGCCTLSSCCQ